MAWLLVALVQAEQAALLLVAQLLLQIKVTQHYAGKHRSQHEIAQQQIPVGFAGFGLHHGADGGAADRTAHWNREPSALAVWLAFTPALGFARRSPRIADGSSNPNRASTRRAVAFATARCLKTFFLILNRLRPLGESGPFQ